MTPEKLVEVSKPKDAPLHQEFEWNNTIAAQKYREEQASCLIRHLIIVRVDIEEIKPYKDRAFVHTGNKEQGYVPLKDALNNETWRENLLKTAYRDMQTFVAKYHRLEELTEVIKDMNQILGERDAG